MQQNLQTNLKWGLLALCVALTAGCAGPKSTPDADTAPSTPDAVRQDAAARDGSTQPKAGASAGPALWVLDDTATKIQILQRLPGADPKRIVQALNKQYPEPGLKWVEKKGSTAVVDVRDGEMLSQRMGSTGAQGYLASVTYSLTSVRGVEQAEIRFPEGDHASPGTFSRKDFDDLFKADTEPAKRQP